MLSSVYYNSDNIIETKIVKSIVSKHSFVVPIKNVKPFRVCSYIELIYHFLF